MRDKLSREDFIETSRKDLHYVNVQKNCTSTYYISHSLFHHSLFIFVIVTRTREHESEYQQTQTDWDGQHRRGDPEQPAVT